jgi:hypothetical protein
MKNTLKPLPPFVVNIPITDQVRHSETLKVSYIDWQDDEGNCGTSYAIILEAESKEEAEVELSTFATNKG